MEEQFLEEILKDTYTLESLKKRVMALKLKVEKKIFNSLEENSPKNKYMPEKGKSNLQEAREWAEGFNKKMLDEVNSGNFKEVFEGIDKFISGATTLSIYFVFMPDEEQLKEVGEWLRTNLRNPKLIFDVKIDPGLIGGLAIAYKGVYKDYSLKAKISGNKEKLMEEFRKYLKN